jgi:hypothetical protein
MVKKEHKVYKGVLSSVRAGVDASSERGVAHILGGQFKREVQFVAARNGYKLKTPDIKMDGQLWELKSPVGHSRKNTVRRQLKRGRRQSRNIVIATQATELDDDFIEKELRRILKSGDMTIRRLIMVDKDGRVRILK